MLYDPVSHYPDNVDEMTFFQDNDLGKAEVINTYNNLVAHGRYTEAASYINQQEGIYGYFSDFFNLIENRIYSVQEYLLNKPPKKQPFVYYDETKSFSSENISIFSDLDEAEPLNTIKLFSDDITSESLDTLQIFINDNENDKEAFIDNMEEELEPPDSTLDTIWI